MKLSKISENLIVILTICTILLVINSCKKDEPLTDPETGLSLIEQSKNYFEENIEGTKNEKEFTISRKGKNLRQFASKQPIWNEAYIKKISVGDAVIVPLAYNATIYTKAGEKKQALSLNNLSYLMIYNTNRGGLTAELVTWIPDDDWWDGIKDKKPFSGKVIVENWRGDFVKGYKYNKDGKIETIKSVKPKINNNGSSVKILICAETEWYICFTVGEYTECRYEYTEVSCTATGSYVGGDDAGGDGSGGGGGANPSDYPPSGDEGNNCPPALKLNSTNVSWAPGNCDEDTPLIPEPPLELEAAELDNAILILDDRPKITDINKYIKCFTDGKTALSYKLTIYVDQPIAGKSDRYILIPPSVTPSPVGLGGIKININNSNYDVGHTFMSFEKMNTDGTTSRQVIGFYPENVIANSKGVIKDDSGRSYDVSLGVTVNESQFNLALNQMKNDFDNATYNLTNLFGREYNCSDASIKWFNSSGINISDSSGGIYKNTPGELGQSLRNNSLTNQRPGSAPNGSGPCY